MGSVSAFTFLGYAATETGMLAPWFAALDFLETNFLAWVKPNSPKQFSWGAKLNWRHSDWQVSALTNTPPQTR